MTAETRSFDAEVGKILHLMIHSLYEQKEIFLRELISNASDACDRLRYAALTEPGLLGEGSDVLKISVAVNPKENTITISDNGIGMSRDELIKNLGTIAKSGTQQFLQKISGDKTKDVNLIGQFGVGFYSAFMVADKVTVLSRKAGKKKAYCWESDGQGKFTIDDATADSLPRGTHITLHLREDAGEYLDAWRLRHIINTYSDHIAFPVELTDAEGKTETVNDGSALWLKPKSEISEEQYHAFYKHVGQAGDTPWMILHNKAEGTLSYTNLLFIPSRRPFDLFHPDRTRRVKLYVKRVFITDENADIIPPYLRFLRGIVDSEDLALNISRETLQQGVTMQKIRQSLTKKILGELKRKAEKAPEEYASFWTNFGAVLKEGLCDGMEPRDDILEACRFYSTQSNGALTSLKDYKSRMQQGQKSIYYITGDDLDTLQKSPQTEGFRKRGIEVLLLCDSVDDFWVNVVNTYDGTELRSVTRAGEELDTLDGTNDTEETADATKKKPNKKSDKKFEALIAFIKETLADNIKDVRISNKLTESPVCLSVQEGAMDIRMERFLIENKQLPGKMAKILEINPSHTIIASLAKDLEKGNKDKKEIADAIYLLFGQASILEGETLSDVAGFSQRLNRILEKALAA